MSYIVNRFDIENKPHVLQFVNALTTVLINGRPFKVEFGGLPKPIIVRDKKHFIRFTLLPRGVRPGFVNIINMEGGRLPTPPPRPDTENSSDSCLSGGEDSNSGENQMRKGHDPVLPMLGQFFLFHCNKTPKIDLRNIAELNTKAIIFLIIRSPRDEKKP